MTVPTVAGFTREVAPGATFWVTGSSFTGTTGITVNGQAAGSVTVASDYLLSATAPYTDSGVVAVTNASGTTTSSASMTILNPRGRIDLAAVDYITGQNITTANFYVFALGTAVVGTRPAAPTGTAVTLYTTKNGSVTVANPLSAGSDGTYTVWVDTPGQYDVVTTDASGAARYTGSLTATTFANDGEVVTAPPVAARGFRSPRRHPHEVWLSVEGSDSAADRGDYDHPYASLTQILTDYLGSATTHYTTFDSTAHVLYPTPLTIRVVPGPLTEWPTIPNGGYTTGTVFSGQAFNIGTSSIQWPATWKLVGAGVDTSGNPSPYYTALFYGNVSAAPLFQVGTANGLASTAAFQGVAFTNVHATGRGVDWRHNTQRAKMENCAIYGCGGDGMRQWAASADHSRFIDVAFMFNGQGTNGAGYHGTDTSSDESSFSAVNLPSFAYCRFKSNVGVDFRFTVPKTSSSGNNLSVTRSYIGSMELMGLRAASITDNYFEQSTKSLPFIRVGRDPNYSADNKGWARGVKIDGNRFNGTAIDAWTTAHAYAYGDVVVPTTANYNGHRYRCTVAGTSAAVTEPTWPTGNNATVTDNGITWTEMDAGTGRAFTTGTARILQVDAGHAILYGPSNIVSGGSNGNSTNPLVVFHATNSEDCEARLHTVHDLSQGDQPPGTAGVNWVTLGSISKNRAEYTDTSAATFLRIGNWYNGIQAVTDTSTVTFDFAFNNIVTWAITADADRTVAAPTNTQAGQIYVLRILNSVGGSYTHTVTWDSTIHMVSSPTIPANGKYRTITFASHGVGAIPGLYEIARVTGDIT